MSGPWSRKMRSPSPSLTSLDLTIEDVFLPAKVSVQCILWLSLVRSAISIERLLNYYHQWDGISMKKIASLLSIDTYVWEAVKIKVLKCYVIFWLAKIFLWEAVKNKRMLCYVIFFDKLIKRFWINITVLYRGVPTPYISPVMASPVTSDIIHRLMIWIIRQDQVCLINIIRIRWFMQTNNMDLLLLYYICFINNYR